MGCDIHEVVEKRIEWGWENCGALGVGRNYNLFSILGNVRNDRKEPVPFIAEGRIEKERWKPLPEPPKEDISGGEI